MGIGAMPDYREMTVQGLRSDLMDSLLNSIRHLKKN
jgi:hypothetical protein